MEQTATLLRSGQVLVSGGEMPWAGSGAENELYRPSSGKWSPAATSASMWNRTAVLLPSGKVLVTGGYDASLSRNSSAASLFDPKTNTWSAAAPMQRTRLGHTATVLRNGKVLVVGGNSHVRPVYGAELFDPATGTWSFTGPVIDLVRSYQTATLLRDGRVLVAGGERSNDSVAQSAEIYDPVTDTWRATAHMMTIGRYRAAAALLPDGRVLVAGGKPDTAYDTPPLATAEIYDPVADTWTPTGSMETGRWRHQMVLLPNGKVLACGGSDASFDPLASAEVYGPSSGRWRTTAPMHNSHDYFTATLLDDGEVLAVGGTGSNSAAAELFVPASGSSPSRGRTMGQAA